MPGKSRLLALTSAALLVACVGPTIAAAEVRLSGNTDQLVLEANNATMSEIIAGIQSTLHTRVVLYGSINRQFNGTYAGPLRRVLAHLLDGADYVMSPDRDQISIVLLGADVSRGTFRVAQGGSPGQPAASPSATADELPNSPVQGWTGVPSELPPRMPPSVNAIATALPDLDVQGWTGVPSELPPRQRPRLRQSQSMNLSSIRISKVGQVVLTLVHTRPCRDRTRTYFRSTKSAREEAGNYQSGLPQRNVAVGPAHVVSAATDPKNIQGTSPDCSTSRTSQSVAITRSRYVVRRAAMAARREALLRRTAALPRSRRFNPQWNATVPNVPSTS